MTEDAPNLTQKEALPLLSNFIYNFCDKTHVHFHSGEVKVSCNYCIYVLETSEIGTISNRSFDS